MVGLLGVGFLGLVNSLNLDNDEKHLGNFLILFKSTSPNSTRLFISCLESKVEAIFAVMEVRGSCAYKLKSLLCRLRCVLVSVIPYYIISTAKLCSIFFLCIMRN